MNRPKDRPRPYFELGNKHPSSALLTFQDLTAPLIGAYFTILLITLSLTHLPNQGHLRLFLAFPLEMLAVSSALVYSRRLLKWIKPISEVIWEDFTVEGANRYQQSPSIGLVSDIIYRHAPKRELTMSQIPSLLSSAFQWVIWGVCLQVLLIGILLNEMERGNFDSFVTAYESAKSFLPVWLAILGPIYAVFALALQNISGGSGSALVILSVIGIPAIFVSPGVRNLLAIPETLYHRGIPRLAGELSRRDISKEKIEGILLFVTWSSVIIYHTIFWTNIFG